MRIIPASVEILSPIDAATMLRAVEIAGRTCYKSEIKITDDSADMFVRGLIKHGHEAMIEHAGFTARFTVARHVSHQIVRHREASYAQESQRYCRYAGDGTDGVTFILPRNIEAGSKAYEIWESACRAAEISYKELLAQSIAPQVARAVLPNSTKTELVMTANMREWRHFFKLRTAKSADPAIREVATLLFKECIKAGLESFFFDITISDE